MARFCFICEQVPAGEFVCSACGERECAICVEPARQLCGACAYEAQSALSLRAVCARTAEG